MSTFGSPRDIDGWTSIRVDLLHRVTVSDIYKVNQFIINTISYVCVGVDDCNLNNANSYTVSQLVWRLVCYQFPMLKV